MKSIKYEIIVVILAIVLSICLIFGIVSCYLNLNTATSVLEANITETAMVAADRISAEITTLQNAAIETGRVVEIFSQEASIADKQSVLDDRIAFYEFEYGNIIANNGKSILDGSDHAGNDYFESAMKGEAYITEPIINPETNQVAYIISAPIYQDGKVGNAVIGAVIFVTGPTILLDIVANIQVSETGYAYIIDQSGTNVADSEIELIGTENSIEDAKSDNQLQALADIENRMISGESGYDTYYYEGTTWVQGYAPIDCANGWSMGVAAEEKDFLGNYYLSIIITLVMAGVFVLIGSVLAIMFGNRIGKPIQHCSDRIVRLAEGDLNSSVPVISRKNEVGILAGATAIVVEKMNGIVGDLTNVLGEMAQGNMRVESAFDYPGDFIPIHEATEKIVESMNQALNQINQTAEQVSSGAEQVSSGAQALSQGATEQASSVEELAANINEVSTKTDNNAKDSIEAKEQVADVREHINCSSSQMHEMMGAMADISTKSTEIGKIIKTIEDIAFQTNILALNAAVEAARAGEAGKGFSVVADEVRNLAGKSAEAASDTTELIEGAVKAVAAGAKIAEETVSALDEVVEKAALVTATVDRISEATVEQAEGIRQITVGIDQIASVVQTNSATSEESAASSQQLSDQAAVMKRLVGRFKIK